MDSPLITDFLSFYFINIKHEVYNQNKKDYKLIR